MLRRTTLGHRAWNQRRRDLAKARAANGTRNVANTKRPRYFLKPPREVEKVYRVKNVRRHSNLRLQLGGSSGSGVSPPLSHRSNRSGRSARSTRSRRRNDRSRRESRASRSARDVRSKVESPGRHGAFTMVRCSRPHVGFGLRTSHTLVSCDAMDRACTSHTPRNRSP